MYSKEAIAKYVRLIKEEVANLERKNTDELKVCISKGNSKIGKVMNISLPPILCCGNCKECKKLCYDIKSNLQYSNVRKARARNMVILKHDRERYFAEIEEALNRRRTNKFFRWHVAGDIQDLDYFARMVDIAKRHKDFIFWTYTKRYDIVNKYCAEHGKSSIPHNLSIMFSEWRGMTMLNPYNFPEFCVVFKDDAERPNGFYCPGNCDLCKAPCRGCLASETTYCDEH